MRAVRPGMSVLLSGILPLCIAAVLPAACPVGAAPGEKTPQVIVVESPVAERWLSQAGVPFLHRTGASLGGHPLSGARLLVLPMEAVATPEAARSVEAFISNGGKVLAVYWGTMSGPGETRSPAASLARLLGVRPVGWLAEAPPGLTLGDSAAGILPYSGPRVPLAACQTTLMDAATGTRILARWSGEEGEELPAQSGAIFLRGGVLYVAPNILRPANERPEFRELFFWALQRLSPQVGLDMQARDRLASAAQACAALWRLGPEASPDTRAQADAAEAALTEARSLLTRSPVRAIAAADRARMLADRLTERGPR